MRCQRAEIITDVDNLSKLSGQNIVIDKKKHLADSSVLERDHRISDTRPTVIIFTNVIIISYICQQFEV